jgi:hypothetical protein
MTILQDFNGNDWEAASTWYHAFPELFNKVLICVVLIGASTTCMQCICDFIQIPFLRISLDLMATSKHVDDTQRYAAIFCWLQFLIGWASADSC